MSVPFTAEQVWFLAEIQPEILVPQQFTLEQLYRLPAGTDGPAVAESFRHLWRTHSSLRATFARDAAGTWSQHLAAATAPVPFRRYGITSLPPADHAAAANDIAAEIAYGLHAGSGPLARFSHFDGGPDHPHYLHVVLHHLTSDLISFDLVMRQFEAAYVALTNGWAVPASRATPFAECTRILNDHANSAILADEYEYWRTLPWDDLAQVRQKRHPGAVLQSRPFKTHLTGEPVGRLVDDVPKATGLSLEHLLMATVAAAATERTRRGICVSYVHNCRPAGWLADPAVLNADGPASRLLHPVDTEGVSSEYTVFPRSPALAVLAHVHDGTLGLLWMFDHYLDRAMVQATADRCHETLREYAALADSA